MEQLNNTETELLQPQKEKSIWALGPFAISFIWVVTIFVAIRSIFIESGIGDVYENTIIAWFASYIVARIGWCAWISNYAEELKNAREEEIRQLQEVALKHYIETKGIK